jgi:uridine kinase
MPKKLVKLNEAKQLHELIDINETEFPILLAKVDNELKELNVTVNRDCMVEFLDITDPNGFSTYQRSVSFMMICAIKEFYGKTVRIVIDHSIDKNMFCHIEDDGIKVNQNFLDAVTARMKKYVADKLPIKKTSLNIDTAHALFDEYGLYDKSRVLKYRRSSNVNVYRLSETYGYFYGHMTPDTTHLGLFELALADDGFMLCFPSVSNPKVLEKYKPHPKIGQVFREAGRWARILNVDGVGAMNDIISQGGATDLIHTSEALHEKKIAQIADQINDKGATAVLISGPSSSGKTTFANRLSVQLKVNGIVPHVISLDNYYKNIGDIPFGENGKQNFEHLDALDVPLIKEDLERLINGERVQIPNFNFYTGTREYKGNFLQLGKHDVLLIEGIHGLNDKLSNHLPKDSKFKIFLSAMTQVNIDDHNRIPTTDARLIRRIVRDDRTRGVDVRRTISMWNSVMYGENNYIFPFREEADVFFNTAMVYELCVLKPYIEPLLFGLSREYDEFTEAKRLIKFLDSFLGIPSDMVPFNSILREFIGGGCYIH